MKNYSIRNVEEGKDISLQKDFENLQMIEGYLGCNWKDEYPGITSIRGKRLSMTLQAIKDSLC